MKKWKKLVIIPVSASLLFSMSGLNKIGAIDGVINIAVPFLGSYPIDVKIFVNKSKTAEETVTGTTILESTNFGEDNKLKQVILASPTAETTRFNFNATFQVNQGENLFIGTLFTLLNKNTQTVENMQPNDTLQSFIDLNVSLDDHLNYVDSNNVIKNAYFDSDTWRPTFIYSMDGQVLADVRDSYTAGNPMKIFDIPTNGLKQFKIRVVPIQNIRPTVAQQNREMSFGFDTENNFNVSPEKASELATARLAMTEAEIAREKALLTRNLNNPSERLTADDLAFLRRFNIYVDGAISGTLRASALGRTVTANVSARDFPPAGIAVSYAYPNVQFVRNDGSDDASTTEREDLISRVYVDYNSSIPNDTQTNQSMPANPTRNRAEFIGWSNVADATEETYEANKFDPNAAITENKTVYAVWRMEKAKLKYAFESATPNKELPTDPEFLALKPADKEVDYGHSVVAEDLESVKSYQARDGEWVMDDFDLTVGSVIDQPETVATGRWSFTPKKANVTYAFAKADNVSEELPEEVLNLKPEDKESVYGAEETPTRPTTTIVEVENGTWTFVGYDKTNETVDSDTITFTGTWDFVYKLVTVQHAYINGSPDIKDALPEEVMRLLPRTEYITYGTYYEAVPPHITTVPTNDGAWVFDGFGGGLVMRGDIVLFRGTWSFVAKEATVNYNFVKANNVTEELPQAVLDLKPDYKPTKYNNVETPTQPTTTRVEVTNGTWTFAGYDKANETANSDTVVFTGTWNFEYKDANVTYEFAKFDSITEELPQAVLDLKPVDKATKYNNVETPVTPTTTSVEVANGTWTFVDYNKVSETVNSDTVVFTGVWNFEYKDANVTYEFNKASGVTEELPQAVLDLKPVDKATKYNNVETPMQPTTTSVEVENGTWTFVGYDKANETVNSDTVVFTGTWNFEYKDANVTYEFNKASGVTEELPQAVLYLKPVDKATKYNNVEEPTQPTTTRVEVANGTWTFEGYDKANETVNSDTVVFTGTWNFTEKTYTISYVVQSADEIPLLGALSNPDSVSGKVSGDAITEPDSYDSNDISARGGIWSFLGWEITEPTITDHDVVVVGKWQFFANDALINEDVPTEFTYVFKSNVEGKELPETVTNKLVNSTVVDLNPVEVADGTWRFVAWELDGENQQSIGYWTFINKQPTINEQPNNDKPQNEQPVKVEEKVSEQTTNTKKDVDTADHTLSYILLAGLSLLGLRKTKKSKLK